jgi:hypothetical protein
VSRISSFLSSETNRGYVYRVLLSIMPLLVAAKVVAPEEADTYLNVAFVVLGIGSTALAVKNTSTSS